MSKFVPTDKSQTTVGLLRDEANVDVQMTIAKEFSTEMKHIHFVIVGKDNSIWIGDSSSSGVILKVKPEGRSLKLISTFNSRLRGMVVTPSGDLLFSDSGPTLKQISHRSGEITDTAYSVAPLLIMSVHMTYNNKIMVGAIADNKGKSLFPPTGRRVVIEMDQTGRQEAVYEYDNNNKRLFSYPEDVSSTRTGSIGVVDRLSSDDKGRVVVLLDGNITGIYTGHPNINNKDKPFIPGRIVATPSDNFIVTDWCTGTLHILDNQGHIITYYNPGMKVPCGLSFSPSGQLYIGTATPKDSNAKLYLVTISGC